MYTLMAFWNSSDGLASIPDIAHTGDGSEGGIPMALRERFGEALRVRL